MADFYYLNTDNQPVGPMGLEGIRKLVTANIVSSDVQVCPAGEEEWKPLSDWEAPANLPIGPPLTPPPPRPSSLGTAGIVSPSWKNLPDWTAPAAAGVGVLSILVTFLPVLAFLLAAPAVAVGVLILKQPTAPKRGLAFAAVITGALGAFPALLFLTGMIWGALTPGAGSFFPSSMERKVVGTWETGTEGQYGEALFGFQMRANLNGNGTCSILWDMGFGSAIPNDSRGSSFGTEATGHWAISDDGESVVATMRESPGFEIRANNGDRSLSTGVAPTEELGGEIMEFEIRRRSDEITLFSYPLGGSRGYTFTKVQ